MKIKEAVNIINSTKTAVAGLWKEKIYFYANDGVDKFDWFLMMPPKANNWNDVEEDFEALYSITPKDLARVMDVIQRLLDTPVNERFPEKKYRLRWIDDGDGGRNYLDNDDDWWSTEDKSYAKQYTESELEQLKKDNPRLAPAIDAMKEPMEGKTDDND
ncbi:hypothetical protein PSA85_06120 [Limosilactobacillus reuteri]|uniref:hypothetical protein n=1 Tax=Limosilactobacillus reuteri TaxID=1598 RepID=UPI00235FA40C|nr:hypothetical protein [Limosilactobacillus reuteri]MDD1406935.1 hypothetical protein [Limosilactobacillus reuteri]